MRDVWGAEALPCPAYLITQGQGPSNGSKSQPGLRRHCRSQRGPLVSTYLVYLYFVGSGRLDLRRRQPWAPNQCSESEIHPSNFPSTTGIVAQKPSPHTCHPPPTRPARTIIVSPDRRSANKSTWALWNTARAANKTGRFDPRKLRPIRDRQTRPR